MITPILVSAMMAIAPLQNHSQVPDIPKQYAVMNPEEEEKKQSSSRRERRANQRRKK